MRKFSRLAVCAMLALLLAPAARAANVVHLKSDTNAPYEKGVSFVTESPFKDSPAPVRLDVLGIRQGDCMVLYAGGQSMLIDGGEADRYPDLKNYLEKRGMDGFDVLFLTHAHADHLGAQEKFVKEGWRVGKVISPYDDSTSIALWKNYRKLLEKRGIPYETVKNGDVIPFGGAELTIYQWIDKGLTLNDQSAAAMLTFGGARLFLAADISGQTQRWLLKTYGAEAFDCDLYKSAHHGNNAVVTEFMDAMSPQACVITNTRGNTATHEKQLDRRDIARYYITMGTVHIETDGETWLMYQTPGTD